MNINDALAKEYNRGIADGKASVEQKHGHWIAQRYSIFKCSECGKFITPLTSGAKPNVYNKYCPGCGAKMYEVME